MKNNKIAIIAASGMFSGVHNLIVSTLKKEADIIEQEKKASNDQFTNNIPFEIKPRDISILSAATVYDPCRSKERKTNRMKPKPKRRKNKKR